VLTVDFRRLALAPGERLLDLGSGGGRHAFEAMRRGARVTALDASAADLKDVAAVAGAMIEAGEAGVDEWAGVVNADALDLPFPNDRFTKADPRPNAVADGYTGRLIDFGLLEMPRVAGVKPLNVSAPASALPLSDHASRKPASPTR